MEGARRRQSAEDDLEARSALWQAIVDATSQLAGHCTIYLSPKPMPGGWVQHGQPIPKVQTWQLVEALSLLATLLRAEHVDTAEVVNLFGKTGPIQFQENGGSRYLWAQFDVRGEQTALGGRPDLIVTSEPGVPSAKTILRVIESKCRRRLGAQDIRAEFGKAHDLRVASYLIWSFTTPSPNIVAGARKLGLDVAELGFDSEGRDELIANPDALVSHVAHTLEQSRNAQRFATMLLKASREATRKLLDGAE